MKRTICVAIGIILLFCFVYDIKARESDAIADTIYICGKRNNQQYKIAGSHISKLNLSGYSPQVVDAKKSSFGRDLGANTYALLTGVGIGEKKDVEFVIQGLIKTEDSRLNWQMDFYCEGSVQKERRSFRNDDGSFSNRIVDLKSIYWGRGANGFILESLDTVGIYAMVVQPEITPELEEMLQDVHEEIFLHSDSLFYLTWEYAIVGAFKGEETAILYNSAANKIYIIEKNTLRGELQLESDLNSTSRKEPFELKLLVHNIFSQDEKDDVLRLAMLGLWMRTLIQ